MMAKVKVSAVSYTNTKPFIHGFEKYPEIFDFMDLSLDVPATCADKLLQNQVDIGLVPVATLLKLEQWKIVSDYCIGANGAVNSVFIFSQVPIGEIRQLELDPESRTSNLLAEILLKFHWNLAVKMTNQPGIAKVLIGDRTFGLQNQYLFVYDLAFEWKKMTGLPFVFAAWVANKTITDSFLHHFNKALAMGLADRKSLINRLPEPENFDLEDYLLHKIDYRLNDDKRKALKLFMDYADKIHENT